MSVYKSHASTKQANQLAACAKGGGDLRKRSQKRRKISESVKLFIRLLSGFISDLK